MTARGRPLITIRKRLGITWLSSTPFPLTPELLREVVRFDEPDEDPFGLERWPLKPCGVISRMAR
jgi:hypothetical protein